MMFQFFLKWHTSCGNAAMSNELAECRYLLKILSLAHLRLLPEFLEKRKISLQNLNKMRKQGLGTFED